jgi:selenide,water dikinase
MPAPALPRDRTEDLAQAIGPKPLCGGCGAKVGRGALQAALAGLPRADRPDITQLPGDDAGLVTMGDTRQVLSVDHLRAVTQDPVLMTRIAAVHALGDIWAMGAAPQAALASLILPRMTPELQRRTLAEIMAAAAGVLAQAGAAIVGGHSTQGDELTIGFTLTGLVAGDPITLAGGQPGDALILTKPLGTGVILAAEMAGRARGAWVTAAYARMVQPQAEAARLLAGAHAMTDVTGFGLAGHLQGICAASGTGAVLTLDAIPLLDGAADLAAAGIRSTLFDDNRALAPALPEGGAADLLFDPQTCGGLLAALPAADADAALAALTEAGYVAARIGTLTDGAPQVTLSG